MSVRRSLDDWRSEALRKIDPQRTALLAIDLQRDFCSADGALAALGSDVSASGAVASKIAGYLPKVRNTVALIAFFQLIYDPAQMSESQHERLVRDGKPIICAPDGTGIDLCVAPAAGDLVFAKRHYSAFTNKAFCRVLRDRSITTVAVAGVDTHICVEGTVRQGYDMGYRMVVLSDLVGTRQSEFARHESSLAVCERYFALVLSSDAFCETLDHQNATLSGSFSR